MKQKEIAPLLRAQGLVIQEGNDILGVTGKWNGRVWQAHLLIYPNSIIIQPAAYMITPNTSYFTTKDKEEKRYIRNRLFISYFIGKLKGAGVWKLVKNKDVYVENKKYYLWGKKGNDINKILNQFKELIS
jgi:hypothetical protein